MLKLLLAQKQRYDAYHGEYTRRAQPTVSCTARHAEIDTDLCGIWSRKNRTVDMETGWIRSWFRPRSSLMTNYVIILLYVCPRAKLRQIVSGSRSRARRAEESRSIRPSYQMPTVRLVSSEGRPLVLLMWS